MTDFADLTALFVNCTLKPSPAPSNTAALMANAAAVMRAQGVTVDEQRAVDLVLAPGVQKDMTEHGEERDDWPAFMRRVLAADILVLGTPIWLGGWGAWWSPATRTTSSTSRCRPCTGCSTSGTNGCAPLCPPRRAGRSPPAAPPRW